MSKGLASIDSKADNKQRKLWIAGGVFGGVLLALYAFSGSSTPEAAHVEAARVTKAVAVLTGKTITGTVTLTQPEPTNPVHITGRITGLDGSALRGFHVHQFGDISTGCMGTGGHFNPFSKDHGAPQDENRHVGDLGNVASDAQGVVNLNIEDVQVSLNGPFSVVGRAIVIHSGTDDLGRGGNDASKLNGNAGGRDACGIIAIAQ